MALPLFRRFAPRDLETTILQNNVGNSIDQIAAQSILGGKLIATVKFSSPSTDTAVAHGLGRTPLGYLVATQNAAASFFTSPNASPDGKNVLLLQASAAVTASFWVF